MAPNLGVLVVQCPVRERRYRIGATNGALARLTPQRVHCMTAHTSDWIVRGVLQRVGVPIVVVVVEQHDRLPAHRRVIVLECRSRDEIEGKLVFGPIPHTIDLMTRKPSVEVDGVEHCTPLRLGQHADSMHR
jgi:hypothetical protein